MYLVKFKDGYLFRSKALDPFSHLSHGIFSRIGGVSRTPYSSMNVSRGVGDRSDAVAANRQLLLHLSRGATHVYTHQNHGTTIRVVTRSGIDSKDQIQWDPQPADALISNVPGIHLVIQTADCQAVMIFDPEKCVAANIHCGWRGSAANIIGKTVSRMTSEFGSDPLRMIAVIGPSLGPCCAEFINYESEIPRHQWPFRVSPDHFDFWEISRRQLADTGIPETQVHGSGMCTRCNPHLFYSYRAARQTGRFAAWIGVDGVKNEWN